MQEAHGRTCLQISGAMPGMSPELSVLPLPLRIIGKIALYVFRIAITVMPLAFICSGNVAHVTTFFFFQCAARQCFRRSLPAFYALFHLSAPSFLFRHIRRETMRPLPSGLPFPAPVSLSRNPIKMDSRAPRSCPPLPFHFQRNAGSVPDRRRGAFPGRSSAATPAHVCRSPEQ